MVKSALTALPAKWVIDKGYQPRVMVIALIRGRSDPPLSSPCQTVPPGESRVALRAAPWEVTAICRHSPPVVNTSARNGSTLPLPLVSVVALTATAEPPANAKILGPAQALWAE